MQSLVRLQPNLNSPLQKRLTRTMGTCFLPRPLVSATIWYMVVMANSRMAMACNAAIVRHCVIGLLNLVPSLARGEGALTIGLLQKPNIPLAVDFILAPARPEHQLALSDRQPGRGHLKPDVRALLRHLVERLVAQPTEPRHARIHQSARGLVWTLQARGAPGPVGSPCLRDRIQPCSAGWPL